MGQRVSLGVSILFLLLGADVVATVYGTDDRVELKSVRSPLIDALGDASVALVKSSFIQPGEDGRFHIESLPYKESSNICPDERFADQRTAAFCSGALVGRDLVLTAGHCAKGPFACGGMGFIFNYSLSDKGVFPESVGPDDAYFCEEVIERVTEDDGRDFALIRLDRPVRGHQPLTVSRVAPELKPGDLVFAIGYPSGLPAKVALNAYVRKLGPHEAVTNLDSFDRSSGSPVFKLPNGELLGILTEGEKDFEFDHERKCNAVKRCADDGCRGESLSRIEDIAPFIP